MKGELKIVRDSYIEARSTDDSYGLDGRYADLDEAFANIANRPVSCDSQWLMVRCNWKRTFTPDGMFLREEVTRIAVGVYTPQKP